MGLRRLISKLDSGETNYGDSYPNHNTPDNVGGFNYGQSISIFDANQSEEEGNQYFFPFNQRSLGYGPQGAKDTTGMFGRLYGSAPYVKQKLPDLNPDKLGPGDHGPVFGDAFDIVDSVTDVGVRGGLITAGKRAVIDAARIGEFLLSAKGLGFITKNVGLQATNPKLQEDAGFLGRNRVYNLGVNTVAQTLANFTGLHITRQGALPVGRANYRVEQGYRVDSENDTKYEFNVRGVDPELTSLGTGNITNLTNVYKGNRLASLYNKLVNPKTSTTSQFPSSWNQPELYKFRGGPHSIYGIGRTRLKRYVFTSRDVSRALETIKDQDEGYQKSRHLGSKSGPTQTSFNGHIIDFRKNRGLPYSDYNQKIGESGQSLEAKFGYPRMGAVYGGGNYHKTPQNEDGTINVRAGNPIRDKINSTDIWIHEGPWDKTALGTEVRDYIKFRIEAVNTDKPTESSTMVFRAYLDSMDDNYSSKWNSYSYNGRAEPFYTFGEFNRSISFSFKVAAFSREDMRPMYRKLNYLVSQTAGEYSQTRLRGNFCRLTIGDYHSRLPGFFTSINLKWNKDYPWEIAMYQNGVGTKASSANSAYNESPQNSLTDKRTEMLADQQRARVDLNKDLKEGQPPFRPGVNPGLIGGEEYKSDQEIGEATVLKSGQIDMDSDMLELPHILDVSCNFQPVHDFIPQKSIDKSPFILPTKYNRADLKVQQNWLGNVSPISQNLYEEQLALAKQEELDMEADALADAKAEEARLEAERKAKQEAEDAAFEAMMEEEIELEEESEVDDDLPPPPPLPDQDEIPVDSGQSPVVNTSIPSVNNPG